jgi:hypothetical protein
MATVLEELQKIVEQLSPYYQRLVLEFAQRLTETEQASVPLSAPTTPLTPGTSGSALLKLRFELSPEDVEAMERALEDCERIEPDEHLDCWTCP